MKNFSLSAMAFAAFLWFGTVSAAGLTGYYAANGIGSSAVNTYPYSYNYNYNSGQNYYQNSGSVGMTSSNTYSTSTGGGGLTSYYAANGVYSNNTTTTPTYNPNYDTTGGGGYTNYFAQNLQANTFSHQCVPVVPPSSQTCQGGTLQPVTNNYGCTVSWQCVGGDFCPNIQEPPASQCNGVWEPQYNVGTQCLTHYFCDRTPDACTQEYQPVCGELNGNYINYSNNCFLTQAGAHFVNEGQCQTTTPTPNKLVINSFTGPNSLEIGQTGTWRVNATAGYNTNINYSIDWGETSYAAQSMMRPRPVQTTTFTHEYAQAGTYQVRITATDEYGKSASATTTVRVEASSYGAPTISSFTGPNTLEVGQSGTWSVMATDPADAPVEFDINWGEPTYSTTNQSHYVRWGSSQTFQHAYSQPGTYQVTVTAKGQGGSTTKTLSVQVTQTQVSNLAPVVYGISGPTSLNVNQTGTWNVQAADPQNQDLMYQIDWGENYAAARSTYSGDAGFVQNSSFTHQYNQAGTYTVSITVKNTAGKTARTTATVRVNEEPTYQPYQVQPNPYTSYQGNTAATQTYNSYNHQYQYYGNSYGTNRHSIFNRGYGR